ncbi:MAG: stage II sporulation protein M [Bacilli bacterium]|nr:stage II sporulation protein M [Bacilli bacterium]
MKKILDKIKNNVGTNKNMLIFLSIIGIIGIIIGTILNIALNPEDSKLVGNFLNDFIYNIQNNNLDYKGSFLNSLISNLGYITFIWLLGISVIGLPITIFIFFTKTFVLGFSISSIIANYKLKGCLLALSYIFPHMIINVFVYIILTMYSLSLSLKIFQTIVKKQTLDFKFIMNKYLKILLISIIIIVITSTIEVFITPNLMKMAISILK